MADQSGNDALYLGFDLSTQQLKAIAVDSTLKLIHEAKVDFDADLSKYGIEKGVLTNPTEGEIFSPVAMLVEAVDIVLERLKEQGLAFDKVVGISGAGMQHGTVFWSLDAEAVLGSLNSGKTLLEQLVGGTKGERAGAFSHPFSPNWQDHSTQSQCEQFEGKIGGPEKLAEVTGSSAHHRFSGPQILRFHQKYPDVYKNTSRISLVSSFLASVFLGRVAPIDIGDVGGMNLWDIKEWRWNEALLDLAAGKDGIDDLRAKLGDVPHDGGKPFGSISKYFVGRYGFPEKCQIVPFTGDNPATILALPLRASDAILSLGTSTTFLMSTNQYKPDPSYHFLPHPATEGLYMFMLCYKNGGLAREQIRDAVNRNDTKSWDNFNETALHTFPLAKIPNSEEDPAKLALYFPRPEIVPNVKSGTWRFLWDKKSNKVTEAKEEEWGGSSTDARAIVESQLLSCRLRSQNLVQKLPGSDLPAQPRRVYLVGGGSVNPAIARICGDVLGGVEGVFRLDIGGNACALGAAYKAAWGTERGDGESFEDFLDKRWKEEGFVKKIDDGYRKGVFEAYGEALPAFAEVEKRVLAVAGAGKTD